jgi:hypothetical protein
MLTATVSIAPQQFFGVFRGTHATELSFHFMSNSQPLGVCLRRERPLGAFRNASAYLKASLVDRWSIISSSNNNRPTSWSTWANMHSAIVFADIVVVRPSRYSTSNTLVSVIKLSLAQPTGFLSSSRSLFVARANSGPSPSLRSASSMFKN